MGFPHLCKRLPYITMRKTGIPFSYCSVLVGTTARRVQPMSGSKFKTRACRQISGKIKLLCMFHKPASKVLDMIQMIPYDSLYREGHRRS
jgi:hypothetical protein